MLKQIDHIGIAVSDLDKSLEKYEKLYQAKATQVVVMEELNIRIGFIQIGKVMLELLQPIVPGEKRIGELLVNRGEGIDHIAYRVDNLDAILEKMKKDGVKLNDETPRAGAHGARIAFVNAEETNNVLVELIELQEDH
jgi:methylmalonyl-CoA epimerase